MCVLPKGTQVTHCVSAKCMVHAGNVKRLHRCIYAVCVKRDVTTLTLPASIIASLGACWVHLILDTGLGLDTQCTWMHMYTTHTHTWTAHTQNTGTHATHNTHLQHTRKTHTCSPHTHTRILLGGCQIVSAEIPSPPPRGVSDHDKSWIQQQTFGTALL